MRLFRLYSGNDQHSAQEPSRACDRAWTQQRIVAKSGWWIAQEPATQRLKSLYGSNRIVLHQACRAAAGRMVAVLALSFQKRDIGNAALSEKIRERRAGDSAADDDDLELASSRHESFPHVQKAELY
jgi:hypothetical protein